MWIPGPITTVHSGHGRPRAAVAVTVAFATRGWFTERTRAGVVVLGNHPFSVGWIYCQDQSQGCRGAQLDEVRTAEELNAINNAAESTDIMACQFVPGILVIR